MRRFERVRFLHIKKPRTCGAGELLQDANVCNSFVSKIGRIESTAFVFLGRVGRLCIVNRQRAFFEWSECSYQM